MGKILFQEKWRNRKLSNFQNQNNHFSLQFLLTQKKLKKNIIPFGKSPNYPEYHIKYILYFYFFCHFFSLFQLNFFGKTLEPHQHALHFSSFDHVFAPVSIGAKQPSVQSYTLFNGSSQTTRFAFDTTILDIVEKVSFYNHLLTGLNKLKLTE